MKGSKWFGILIVVALLLSSAIGSGVSNLAAAPGVDEQINQITVIYHEDGSMTRASVAGGSEEEGYILLGFKLYETATYRVNPKHSGQPANAVIGEIASAFEAWDDVTGGEQFNDTVSTTTKQGSRYDGQNTISWVNLRPGVVAQTTIWYQKVEGDYDRIVEFDICFNRLYRWGIDPDDEGEITINAFDIQNVATHEAGHVVGLGDLYESYNSYLTMYGYTSRGEVQKISLEEKDISGAQLIYGSL